MTALTARFEVTNHNGTRIPGLGSGSGEVVKRPLGIELTSLTDEQLVLRARREPAQRTLCMDELFRRVNPRVASWCLRFCHNREDAADLAQEVVMRAYQKIDSFRAESRFTTWLYTLMRRLAVDRGLAARRRENVIAGPILMEPEDNAETVDETLSREQVLLQLHDCMKQDLESLEARVVYLHYIDGMTLPAITNMLELGNKSGAKAYLLGGMRKLRRRFGPWLLRQHDAGNT